MKFEDNVYIGGIQTGPDGITIIVGQMEDYEEGELVILIWSPDGVLSEYSYKDYLGTDYSEEDYAVRIEDLIKIITEDLKFCENNGVIETTANLIRSSLLPDKSNG